jgi:phosphate transport system substrate-binding protein
MLSSNFGRLSTLTAAVVFAALPIGCSTKPATTNSSSPVANDSSKPAGAEVTLSGAGATFPQPLYERYSKEIKKDRPDLKINYQGIGSGGGVKQTIAGTVDFGASDAAMTDEEIGKVPGGVLMIPTAGGAVSVVYNLAGVENLKLSNPVLAGIFTNKITTWNDPQIAKDNPGAKLPTGSIKPVVRADGSGTSFIFSNHVSSINPEFKASVGASKEPKWPATFLKGKGNPGVASLVKQTPGSIGYVEYEVALKNKLTAASVQNGSGEYIAPTPKTASEALSDVKFPENFRVFDVNSPKGYPIVGLTWLLIPKTQKDPAKSQAIKGMVKWILTTGQKFNQELNYTSIPSSVATRAIAAVDNGLK